MPPLTGVRSRWNAAIEADVVFPGAENVNVMLCVDAHLFPEPLPLVQTRVTLGVDTLPVVTRVSVPPFISLTVPLGSTRNVPVVEELPITFPISGEVPALDELKEIAPSAIAACDCAHIASVARNADRSDGDDLTWRPQVAREGQQSLASR